MESNIQFAHCRKVDFWDDILPRGGATLAIEMPSVSMLDVMEIGGVYSVSLGISQCHEEDLYNKKIGRNVAAGRIQERFCKVEHKFIGHDYLEVHLSYKGYLVVIEKKFLGNARVLTFFKD